MRGYECYIYHLDKNNKLVKNQNNSCWAGLKEKFYYFKPANVEPISSHNKNVEIDLKPGFERIIFINKYKDNSGKVTEKDQKRIVYLINKITPCSIVLINGKNYIKYALLKNHYSNLLLLNFIRTLWHYPNCTKKFNIDQYYIDINKRIPNKMDVLSFMLKCVKDNISEIVNYEGDHNFIYNDIKIKTKQQLLDYIGQSMEYFLKKRITSL